MIFRNVIQFFIFLCVTVAFKDGSIQQFPYQKILNSSNWTCDKNEVCLYNRDNDRMYIPKNNVLWVKDKCDVPHKN